MKFAYSQIDVFTATPGRGNPLAVVHGAERLDSAQMQAFANWTNLSETAFLLPPTDPAADYRLRIFTPLAELPFAGHPTLGSCHAWLEAGGNPAGAEIVQQCGAGLVRLRREDKRLAFAAPPAAQRPLAAAELAHVAACLRLAPAAIREAWHLSATAPAWIGVLLADRAAVLAVRPDYAAMGELMIGIVAPSPEGPGDFEVRGFSADVGGEDPVTGSLNGQLARWLIGTGRAPARYVAAQGSVLGREGRVHVRFDGTDYWIGGQSLSLITGTVKF